MRAIQKPIVAAVLLWAALPALGAQVVPMSLEQLADHSGQVIIGTVSNVRSYWAQNPRRIESQIIFDTVTYLKGATPKSSAEFELTVPGGKIDDLQMRVCCAPEFGVGEKWLVMLLPTYKTYPVVGVYRGAVRIKSDGAGVERIYDPAGRSITRVGTDGHVVLDGQAQADAAQHLVGGRGARLNLQQPRDTSTQVAMPLSDFLSELRPVLAKSHRHTMNHPAGRRIAANLTPVALKESPGGRDAEQDPIETRRELPKPKEAGVDPRGKGARP